MIYDEINLVDGAAIVNLTVDSGIANPTTGLNVGELFFNTSDNTLYIYTGASWESTSGAAGDPHFTHEGTTPTTAPTALGEDALSIGDGGTDANGKRSIAIGYNAIVENTANNGWGAIAIGELARGYYGGCTAIGTGAEAGTSAGNFWGSTAIGAYAYAYHNQSVAIGSNSIAGSFGDDTTGECVAIGISAQANKVFSLAIGSAPFANGDNSIAIGKNTTALAASSTTIGDDNECSATAVGGIAIGRNSGFNGARNTDAIAIGSYTLASGVDSIALGRNTDSTDTGTIAIGAGSQSRDANAIAIGGSNSFPTHAYENQCIAIGTAAKAGQTAGGGTTEEGAIAIGNSALAYELRGIAIGQSSQSGKNGTSDDPEAIAIGYGAKAYESNSIVIGNGAIADVANTIAIGQSAHTTNKGEIVHSVGSIGTAVFNKTIVIKQAMTVGALTAMTDSPTVPLNKAWKFTINIVARQNTTGDTAAFKFDGLIKNIGGTTSLVGAPAKMVQKEDATWDCAVVANDTTDKLEIQFQTDGTADAVNVLANIHLAEV